MILFDLITINNEYSQLAFDSSQEEYAGWGKLSNNYDSIDEYEIMGYAGLKDKNSKEIYEGDIVEFNQHATYEKIKADIIFIRCGFTAHYYKSKSIEVWTNLPLNEEDQDTMEVIGNIYENPELLTTE